MQVRSRMWAQYKCALDPLTCDPFEPVFSFCPSERWAQQFSTWFQAPELAEPVPHRFTPATKNLSQSPSSCRHSLFSCICLCFSSAWGIPEVGGGDNLFGFLFLTGAPVRAGKAARRRSAKEVGRTKGRPAVKGPKSGQNITHQKSHRYNSF